MKQGKHSALINLVYALWAFFRGPAPFSFVFFYALAVPASFFLIADHALGNLSGVDRLYEAIGMPTTIFIKVQLWLLASSIATALAHIIHRRIKVFRRGEDTHPKKQPIYATVAQIIVSRRLWLVVGSLSLCIIYEWASYKFSDYGMSTTGCFWFYGIAGFAFLDCLLLYVRRRASAYGHNALEFLEITTEVQKHVKNHNDPGTGPHFYVDEYETNKRPIVAATSSRRGATS